jgi:hypothetical protein
MSTESIVGILIVERDKLNRAIQALGGEVSGGSAPVKRPGRPAKTATVAPIPPAKSGGIANYIPRAVYDNGALCEGFVDLTSGVFQICDPAVLCVHTPPPCTPPGVPQNTTTL